MIPKTIFGLDRSNEFDWKKCTSDRKDDCREEICNLDLFAEHKIDADAEDQDISDDRKVEKGNIGHDRLYEQGKSRHAAL